MRQIYTVCKNTVDKSPKLPLLPSEVTYEEGKKDLYGSEYYSWLSQQRTIRGGWPKGKLRKPGVIKEMSEKSIRRLGLRPEVEAIFLEMLEACVPAK